MVGCSLGHCMYGGWGDPIHLPRLPSHRRLVLCQLLVVLLPNHGDDRIWGYPPLHRHRQRHRLWGCHVFPVFDQLDAPWDGMRHFKWEIVIRDHFFFVSNLFFIQFLVVTILIPFWNNSTLLMLINDKLSHKYYQDEEVERLMRGVDDGVDSEEEEGGYQNQTTTTLIHNNIPKEDMKETEEEGKNPTNRQTTSNSFDILLDENDDIEEEEEEHFDL